MKTRLLYLFTRTPLHVGAGASVGAIDQPVQRERHTGFPIIPGSAIKGVLADLYLDDRQKGTRSPDGIALFGRQDHEVDVEAGFKHKSGDISVGGACLLAFPVRSAKGCFAWVTSPLLIKRWEESSHQSVRVPAKPQGLELYGPEGTLAHEGTVVLEDYALEVKGGFDGGPLKTCFPDSLWAELCDDHLCLISDDMMAHFAVTACEVAQHVSINDETGTADDGKLFNQENVPAETLFYSVLTELRSGALTKLSVPEVIQVGGDATTGIGYCSTRIKEVSRP